MLLGSAKVICGLDKAFRTKVKFMCHTTMLPQRMDNGLLINGLTLEKAKRPKVAKLKFSPNKHAVQSFQVTLKRGKGYGFHPFLLVCFILQADSSICPVACLLVDKRTDMMHIYLTLPGSDAKNKSNMSLLKTYCFSFLNETTKYCWHLL